MDLDEIGLNYLTASSLSHWRDSPANWVMVKLMGAQPEYKASFARAVAIREGVKHAIFFEDPRAGEDVIERVFQEKVKSWKISPQQAIIEEGSILALYDVLVKEIQGHGFLKKPLASNLSKVVWINDLSVPLLSAVDFVFDELQLKVKTTMRCPKAIQPRDMAALSIDAMARDQPTAIVYATPKKSIWLEPDPSELTEALDGLYHEARSVETFLRTAESPQHALAMLPIDPGHFRWSPTSLARAIETLKTSQEAIHAIIRSKDGGFSERATRNARLDLLPASGSWDPESDMEW